MKCSMQSVILGLELRRIREGNASLAAVVTEYNMRVKNLGKKADDKEVDGMAVMRETKMTKEEVDRLECKNKLYDRRQKWDSSALVRTLVLLRDMFGDLYRCWRPTLVDYG